MRDAKSGQWWVTNPQRALANNSAVYDGPVEPGQFMEEWLALYKSKSGERGIFNREAARKGIDRTPLTEARRTGNGKLSITSEPTRVLISSCEIVSFVISLRCRESR